MAVEQRAKSNSHRIDKLEKNQEAIQQLALSVRELATQMQGMREDQADTSKRLAEDVYKRQRLQSLRRPKKSPLTAPKRPT